MYTCVQVTLLLRDPYLCKDINELHCNTRYLKVQQEQHSLEAGCGCAQCLLCKGPAWGADSVLSRQGWQPSRVQRDPCSKAGCLLQRWRAGKPAMGDLLQR
jgi:hypothetical protein